MSLVLVLEECNKHKILIQQCVELALKNNLLPYPQKSL